MKTAIYVEDGIVQLVLTPENEFEKAIFTLSNVGKIDGIYKGSFYECRGGFVRQGNNDESLIIKLKR